VFINELLGVEIEETRENIERTHVKAVHQHPTLITYHPI